MTNRSLTIRKNAFPDGKGGKSQKRQKRERDRHTDTHTHTHKDRHKRNEMIDYVDKNGVDVVGEAVALERGQIRPEIIRCEIHKMTVMIRRW